MARKESQAPVPHRGFSDIIGIILIAAALLLLVAQLSFESSDVAFNKVPPNKMAHNWIGQAGALGASGLFFLFGAGAFVLPILLLLFGLGYLFEFLAYLKRRWAWAAVLFFTCLGAADLYGVDRCDHRLILQLPASDGQEAKIDMRVRTATQDGLGKRLGAYRYLGVKYQATKELEEVEVHTKQAGPST